MKKYLALLKTGWLGLLLACFIGGIAYLIELIVGSPLVESLLIALVIGIIVRTVIGDNKKLTPGFTLAPLVFIPLGAMFYGAVNLNFVKFAKVDIRFIILLIIIMFVYFGVVFLLGKLLKQRKQITCLVATGSAICGASAIIITAPALEAEADDISISLISVFLAALFGLFILFPFLTSLFDMGERLYALFSGMTLQFTGFVKAATGALGKETQTLALSVKGVRYLGLLIAVPLFSSVIKKRFHIPWFLWLFLGAGLIFSFLPTIAKSLNQIFKPSLIVLWSIALSGVGLNADLKALLSDNGLKALLMAFVGFFAAVAVFILGSFLIM